MISLVDTAKCRRAISFNGGSLDQNSNGVKGTKRELSFRRRLFRSMRSRRAAASLDEASTSSSASSSSADVHRTISSDTLLNERNAISFTPSEELRSPGSFSSNSSNDRKGNDGDDVPRQTVKKKKYFSSERNKNLFKKLLHPNYQERNAQYRKLFGNVVPDDDLFLISFSCAYQREILCQGRMYISQRHICFHANILGWETRLAIPIDQVAVITKEKAALIFPNSIQIETVKQEKYFFASFVNREKTSTALSLVHKAVEGGAVVSPEEMWEKMNPERQQINSPLEKPVSNGRHRGGDGIRSSASSPLEGISLPSSLASPSLDFAPVPEGGQDQMSSASSVEDLVDASCPCSDHFGRLLLDAVFPLSVGELYRLVFHDEPWSQKFNQVLRNTGYEASAWAKDKDGVEGRICTYTMELNHAMAPKNCVVTEKQTIQHLDEQMDVVVVHKETQNSGVPYADHFTVNCNYCLTRVGGSGQTRLKVHGGLNYKKTIWSMVKGYIEKSTYQGLEQHYTALETTLKKECAIRTTNTMLTTENDDRDSVASSVEDPSPETPNRTTVAPPALEQRLSPVKSMLQSSHAVPIVQPDYSLYIRIIICLLAGLCVLQILLLFRPTGQTADLGPLRMDIQTLSKRLSTGQVSETTHTRETEMLQTLLSTVEQLAADLQKMKREREEL